MKIQKSGSILLSFWIALSLVASFFSPLIASSAPPPPVNLTLSASKTAWIDELNLNENFSSSTVMFVQSSNGDNERALISFDLSSIPANATITSASMSLFLLTPPASDRVINLYDISDPFAWSEATLTWNSQPVASTTVVASAPIASSSPQGFISWNVTSEVSKMVSGAIPNQGWELRDSAESGTSAESKLSLFSARTFATTADQPTLSVTYTLSAATTASISGKVSNDLNGDGIISAGEPGLAGWTVSLFSNSATTTASTTLTDTSGNYSFGSLPDGAYQVCESLASSTPAWRETFPTSGFNCGAGLFGYNITIASSTDVTGQNFADSTTTPIVATTTPAVPTLLSPTNGATVAPGNFSLGWSAVTVSASSSPVTYAYQIATSSATTTLNSFATPLSTSTATTTALQASVSGLADGAYFWQVRACDVNSICSNWSDPFQFNLVTPAVQPVSNSGGGGGGGGNGPIVGTYGLVSTASANNFSTNNVAGGSSGGGTGISTGNAGGSENNAVVLVPPGTSGQSVLPAPYQNQTSDGSQIAQGTTGAGNEYVTPPAESSGASQATTTQPSSQVTPTPNNSSQAAAVATSSSSFFSAGFWIWAIVILIVIGLVVLLFRSAAS